MQQPLPQALAFYRQILTIQNDAAGAITLTADITNIAAERIASGKPGISLADIDIDWSVVQTTLSRLSSVIDDFLNVNAEERDEFENLIVEQPQIRKAATEWFQKGNGVDHTKSNSYKPLIDGLLQVALNPYLHAASLQIAPTINQQSWQKGYCPVCGGLPDFSYLDREKGSRWLMCSRCDSTWQFPRLTCPSCGNHDPATLKYLPSDAGNYRLYTCDDCGSYLKCIDLRNARADILLFLERILTLDMDKQAYDLGYSPLTVNSSQ